jgi:hypothetical protein
MASLSYAAKLAGVALIVFGALLIAASDAMAAKEQFTRNKPHVNVGTTGSTSQPSGPGGVTSAPSQPTEGEAEGECPKRPTGETGTGTPPTC